MPRPTRKLILYRFQKALETIDRTAVYLLEVESLSEGRPEKVKQLIDQALKGLKMLRDMIELGQGLYRGTPGGAVTHQALENFQNQG